MKFKAFNKELYLPCFWLFFIVAFNNSSTVESKTKEPELTIKKSSKNAGGFVKYNNKPQPLFLYIRQ